MARSMTHLNGNILAAVDVETTGLNPFFHEIIQVCVLPLDSNLVPLKGIIPFYGEMKPEHPERADYKAMGVTKIKLCELMVKSLTADRMADLFESWYTKLPLPLGKKLIPLAHNWVFDHAFISRWLGWESMNNFFYGHGRDLQTAALYENDKADFQVEQTPYPKVGLKYLCSQLGVENDRAHDALSDCIATAAAYSKLLKKH